VLIAADSGVDHALAAGWCPDVAVGDFDSITAAGLAWVRSSGAEVFEHPPAKDATDTELALVTAVRRGATDVILVSGGGDRLDHSISALVALGLPLLSRCSSVSARWTDSWVHVLHGPRSVSLTVPIGATFSVLALHGACSGVCQTGAAWSLDDARLAPGSSLGISNVATDSLITVSVGTGVLTVIVPDAEVVRATSAARSGGAS
jgi:thiamine pyrophosphokinase